MGISCPEQKAQPFGLKFPPNILISPMYGWLIPFSFEFYFLTAFSTPGSGPDANR